MIELLLSFIIILNPFALCLYLSGIIEDLDSSQFFKVLSLASLVSYLVFAIFALFGDKLLITVFSIRTEALRCFGGLVFLVVAYNYVTKGSSEATAILRGSLDELPSQIAVPFMIGAGTITQAILIGKKSNALSSVIILFVAVAVSTSFVLIFKYIRDKIKERNIQAFDRYVNILSRINGLIIGAISIEMIVSGILGLWTFESHGGMFY
jgi:multiple antibiotic resistance protein